jgi:predicted peptidase
MSWMFQQLNRKVADSPAAISLSLLTCLLLSCAGGCTGAFVASSTEHFAPQTGFMRTEIVSDGESHNMWVFIPKNYRPSDRYPAILFLHGLFEAGNGGDKVLSAGLGPVIAQDPDHWPFITLFPQSPGNWQGPDRDRLAMAALDFAMRHWSIDQDRVILAGLSFGGQGTWEIGAQHPDRFAALVPVSGPSALDAVQSLLLMPVWAFHFKDDPWVKSENSEEMCKAIDSLGGQARLTEFSGAGHDAWSLAVTESRLVQWMLQQRRPGGPQASAFSPQRPTMRAPSPGSARSLAFSPFASSGNN